MVLQLQLVLHAPFNHEEITGSLRLTLGIQNTEHEIEQTVANLSKVVHELREFSPYKFKYAMNQ